MIPEGQGHFVFSLQHIERLGEKAEMVGTLDWTT